MSTIGRIQQDAEQIENLLGRAGAARKNDDAVPQPHERLQALLDVRHDDQLADDGIRRLGRDDARLGDAQIAAVDDALLRMPDGGALHRPLHGAGPAARAHIEAAQAEFVADFLGVVVLDAADGMPSPAHHQFRPHLRLQHPGVAQDVKYRVGDARGGSQIEAAAVDDLVGDEYDVAQHGEQMILQAADHLAVDERRGRRVLDLELDAPGAAHDAQIEVPVLLENRARIVEIAAGIEHRERAFAKQRVQAALAGIEKFGDLLLREVLEAALGRDSGIDQVRGEDRGFHAAPSTDRCRSGCCPGCASTLRPCRNWTRRCSRPSNRWRSNRPPDASGRWADHGS